MLLTGDTQSEAEARLLSQGGADLRLTFSRSVIMDRHIRARRNSSLPSSQLVLDPIKRILTAVFL